MLYCGDLIKEKVAHTLAKIGVGGRMLNANEYNFVPFLANVLHFST